MVQSSIVVASAPADVLRYAAAFFLVVVAIGLVIALIRLAQTLNRVDKLVEDTDREMVPLLSRAQVTLDQVNSELGKVDEILASAVNVTNKVDATTNVVQTAVTAPAKKAAAFSAGVTQAVSSFFARHNDEGAATSSGQGPDEPSGARPSWESTWSQSTSGTAAAEAPVTPVAGPSTTAAEEAPPSAAGAEAPAEKEDTQGTSSTSDGTSSA